MLWPCKAEGRILDSFQYMHYTLPLFKKQNLANLQKRSIESLLHSFLVMKTWDKVNYWTLWKTLPILLKFGVDKWSIKVGVTFGFFIKLPHHRGLHLLLNCFFTRSIQFFLVFFFVLLHVSCMLFSLQSKTHVVIFSSRIFVF